MCTIAFSLQGGNLASRGSTDHVAQFTALSSALKVDTSSLPTSGQSDLRQGKRFGLFTIRGQSRHLPCGTGVGMNASMFAKRWDCKEMGALPTLIPCAQ